MRVLEQEDRIPPGNGFSLVELIIAMLVLTFGLLGMAATSGYMSLQIRMANLRTERMAAVQEVVEELRATPFDQITTRPQSEAVTVGSFRVWWIVRPQTQNLLHLDVASEGPGFLTGTGWINDAGDMLVISVARSVPMAPPAGGET
jgi:Tfp pilus assembly protein PilV